MKEGKEKEQVDGKGLEKRQTRKGESGQPQKSSKLDAYCSQYYLPKFYVNRLNIDLPRVVTRSP